MESIVQSPTPMFSGEQLDGMAPTAVNGTGARDISPQQREQREREVLKTLVRRQVEYYFSRDNLNHDTYLVSQMDSDQYVDISIIARFNQVKRLTDELELLVEVLKESPCVQVDETERKVRPLHKRCMVIIREVPEDTSKAEMENMLKHSDCPPFEKCEYASGNCWYIEFQTEEHAKIAFDYIRVQTFKGQPLKARIKSKPSTAASNPGRSEQSRPDIPISTVADSIRPTVPIQPTNPSAIRYPVPLQHIPLQTPAPYPYTVSSGHQIQYVPYAFVPQAQLFSPSWNYPEQPAYTYEVNPNYAYQQTAMPNQPRQGSQQPAAGQPVREWKGHGRSDRVNGNVSDRANESNRSTNTASKTGYYNGRGNSESSNHHKHNGAANRNRSSFDSQSNHDRNYDNIPPRLRNAQRDRSNKDKRISSGQHNYAHTTPSSQPSAGQYSRRSLSSHQHRGNPTSNGTNGANHLPHSRGGTGPSPPVAHPDRAAKEYTNKQPDLPVHSHNRSHANHRNSKSPEKEQEQTPYQDITKREDFELDSNAFPALPGANTATTISDSTDAADAAASLVTTTTTANTLSGASNQDAKPTFSQGASTEIEKGGNKSECGGVVSKLSDIVKNNIHELSKIADAAKSTKSSHAANAHKESNDKSAQAAAPKSHLNAKSQSSSHQKGRPTHLTNGVHTDASSSKSAAHSKTSGRPAAPVAKATDTPTAQSNKKDPQGEQDTVGADAKAANVVQGSPSDSKISYADAAKTASVPSTLPVAAPVKVSPTQDTSPISPTGCSSSGDNNNNADCKSTSNSRVENLQYSAAAKTAPNASTTATNSPRKAATPQQVRNGPTKPKNGDGRPAPSSPPNRNPASSHSAASSATLLAR